MNKMEDFKVNIQLFADNDETHDEGQGGEENKEPKTYTEEEVEKKLQAESDRRVTKALQTAKEKWEQEFSQKLEKEKQEAEELAKLSEKERAKVEFEKQQKEFENERKQFQRERLELQTVKELSARNLPSEFANFVMGENAEATMERLAAFEAQWQKSIESTINDRLKGTKPKTGGSVNELDQLKEKLSKATKLEERLMIKREIDKLEK